jgi:hypothetical protein
VLQLAKRTEAPEMAAVTRDLDTFDESSVMEVDKDFVS